MIHRPRRLRRTALLREALAETRVHRSQLIVPHFVREGGGADQPVEAMPGVARHSIARLVEQAGFPAVYMTGFGVSASRLGLPDLGFAGLAEMVDRTVVLGEDRGGPLRGPPRDRVGLRAGAEVLDLAQP